MILLPITEALMFHQNKTNKVIKMKKVYFLNAGEIDIDAVTTFGVNAKSTENPFGFFGTGLKYAIAILLRNGHKITIHSGMTEHVFGYIEKEIRGKTFAVVCLDGQQLGFTLDLGKTWKLWQAYRELYCNTIDEDGEITTLFKKPSAGTTLIVVDGDDFADEHAKRDEIILNTKPIYDFCGLSVHAGLSTQMHLKTIRVRALPNQSIFTYNLTTPVALTEDRTIKSDYDADKVVRRAVVCGDNAEFIKAFICAPMETYEQKLDCLWGDVPSETFMQVVQATDFKHITNLTALTKYKQHSEKTKKPFPANMTDIEKQQLQLSIDFCSTIGFDVSKNKINVTDDLNQNVLGMVYADEIYLSRQVFMQGTKQVAATLLEEHLHLDMKFEDKTYSFQTYLFDLVVTLGERLNGKPV